MATKKATKKAAKKAATKRASKITLKDDTLYVLSIRSKMLTWQPVSVFETYEQASAERDRLESESILGIATAKVSVVKLIR